ncbi:hypothetical protein QOZ80_3BG0279940 [Eleusine coracana subsp. coracana]|nr:hypothetical protein QOZ80_3BG0279940 [Eleusine coracana subsp. coracana]
MATVQHPRRLPPPQAPPAPSHQAPPAVARAQQLPCKRRRSRGGTEERVADSCYPMTELVVIDDDGDSGDEDGCGSCVDGSGRQDGDDVEVSGGGGVWWRQRQESSSSSRCFVLAGGSTTTMEHERAGVKCGEDEEDDDPTVVAARRREEDRKFWEACLASGYPA